MAEVVVPGVPFSIQDVARKIADSKPVGMESVRQALSMILNKGRNRLVINGEEYMVHREEGIPEWGKRGRAPVSWVLLRKR